MEPLEDESDRPPPYRHSTILPTRRLGSLLHDPDDGQGYVLGQSALSTEPIEAEFDGPPPYRHSPILPSYRAGSLLQNPEPGLEERPGQEVYALSGRPRAPSMMLAGGFDSSPSPERADATPEQAGSRWGGIDVYGFADMPTHTRHETSDDERRMKREGYARFNSLQTAGDQTAEDRKAEGRKSEDQTAKELGDTRSRSMMQEQSATRQKSPPDTRLSSDLSTHDQKESDLKTEKMDALQGLSLIHI